MSQRVLPPPMALLGPTRAAAQVADSADESLGPPRRPPIFEERLANRLFLALSPRLRRVRLAEPPCHLEPFEPFAIERSQGRGALAATWYPAYGAARGAVLLVHPWTRWGQSYFHHRGRIGSLRAAGHHVLTFDLSGIGGSSGARPGFYDRDIEDALAALQRRAAGLPRHLWGVSCGGYWAHFALSRVAVAGAMFEDVSCHLIDWSSRMAPWGWPFYGFFRHALPRAYRYMDAQRHAPHLRARAVAYLSGELDRGVLPAETRQLAHLAAAEVRIVRHADHLESIEREGEAVIASALGTFERAEAASGSGEGTAAA